MCQKYDKILEEVVTHMVTVHGSGQLPYIVEKIEWRNIMTYEEIFQKFKDAIIDTDVSGVNENLAFQFNITGEGAGSFYAEVKDGKLSIEPYEYYDRNAIFICSAETLFKIMEGKTDPMIAFTLGKLKVEGDLGKALKLKEFISKK